MKLDASAGRNRIVDLRNHCENLKMKATCPDEARFLASLYRTIVFGGTVTTVRCDGSTHTVEFDGSEEIPERTSQ